MRKQLRGGFDMRLTSSIRSVLLAGSAISLVAACVDAEVATPGDSNIGPINVVGGGNGSAALQFAQRASAPASAADCPAPLVFTPDVTLVNSANQPITGSAGLAITSNFCALPSPITGTVSIPLQDDPILVSGTVFIGNDDGDGSTAGDPANRADVAFAAGQVFMAEQVDGVLDLIVVSRGSEMDAIGTQNSPIIFTSNADFSDDGLPNGTSDTGDWGGLAINGRAANNRGERSGEGGSGLYGGAIDTDTSGELRYVRIQHAGFSFTPDNQLNTIALQSVGSGTRLSFIQAHRGADDGFEWFGGTVDMDHAVVTGAIDDSIDWTDGWRGNLQFALVVQNPGDDNGIEGDNRSSDPNLGDGVGLRSNPTVSNLTLIGDGEAGGGDEGMQLRNGTQGIVLNTLITNFRQGFEYNLTNSDNGITTTGGNPTVLGLVVSGNSSAFAGDSAAEYATEITNGDITEIANASVNGVFPGINELAPTPVDPTGFGLAAGSFIGAFGPSETETDNWTTGWTVPGSIPAGDCPTGTVLASETPQSAGFINATESAICVVANPVLGDVTLTAGRIYRLDGTVFVGNDDGQTATDTANIGTLTIDPGVTVFGNCGGTAGSCGTGNVDLLVVSRGSQMFAEGSPSAPIIFTSRDDLVAGGDTVRDAQGEFGGLAINGRAPNNRGERSGEGGSGLYGGAIDGDNSGSLQYVQVRYAGFSFTPDNQLNGVALQSVGDGTNIDFIQVIDGADDGIEWFGGTVDVKHAVILGAVDDSIDWTDGWNGSLQYAIVKQNNGDDNGIEGDNRSSDPNLGAPTLRSRPTIANVTLIGDADAGGGDEGIQLRNGTEGWVFNSIVTNFRQGLEYNLTNSDNGITTTGLNPTIQGLSISVSASADFAGDASAELVDQDNGTANVGNIENFATSTLTQPAGFPFPLVPGANETADGVNLIAADAAQYTATDPELDTAGAAYLGAIENAADTWFAGWTLGL